MSNFMNVIMTCVFYAPLIPHAIICAWVSTHVMYLSFKFHLLRTKLRPQELSDIMAMFFSNSMPWLVLIGAIGAFYFYSEQEKAFTPSVITGEQGKLFLYCLIFAVLYMFCPFRLCINYYYDKDVNEDKAGDED